MPLAKYFLFVGGVLLALLYALNASLPNLPVSERPQAEKPVIRIHSDRKWPERVVFDTSIPTIVPPVAAQAQIPAPVVANVPGRGEVRDALAQLTPKDAPPAGASVFKTQEQKPPRKRKIAKRRVAPQMMVVEQQPRLGFGFFGNNIW